MVLLSYIGGKASAAEHSGRYSTGCSDASLSVLWGRLGRVLLRPKRHDGVRLRHLRGPGSFLVNPQRYCMNMQKNMLRSNVEFLLEIIILLEIILRQILLEEYKLDGKIYLLRLDCFMEKIMIQNILLIMLLITSMRLFNLFSKRKIYPLIINYEYIYTYIKSYVFYDYTIFFP